MQFLLKYVLKALIFIRVKSLTKFSTKKYLNSISVVQLKLIEKRADMNEDDFFCSIIDSTVTSFQERTGLTAGGVVGPEVLKALEIS